MRCARILAFIALFFVVSTPALASLRIAAAADLKFAMDDVLSEFRRSRPGVRIDVAYGSSGQFKTQIQQGAPYDLFFSADIAFPRELHAAGLAASDVVPYAVGRIVLWSARHDARGLTLRDLPRTELHRIAIASTVHAPYGMRAEEALRAAGVWSAVEPRLVYGENIAQTAQFVQSGNASIGIIALSLALSPQLRAQGGYALIPDSLHAPLEQGFIVTRRAARNPLAHAFAGHMQTPGTRAIMARYGFELPARADRLR